MIRMLEEEVRKRGGDVEKVRAWTQRVAEAKNPGKFA